MHQHPGAMRHGTRWELRRQDRELVLWARLCPQLRRRSHGNRAIHGLPFAQARTEAINHAYDFCAYSMPASAVITAANVTCATSGVAAAASTPMPITGTELPANSAIR